MYKHTMTSTTVYMSKLNMMMSITVITHAFYLFTLEIKVIKAIFVKQWHEVVTIYLHSDPSHQKYDMLHRTSIQLFGRTIKFVEYCMHMTILIPVCKHMCCLKLCLFVWKHACFSYYQRFIKLFLNEHKLPQQ